MILPEEGIQARKIQMTPGGTLWQRHELPNGVLLVSPDCDPELLRPVLRAAVEKPTTLQPVDVQGEGSSAYHVGANHILKVIANHRLTSNPDTNSRLWGLWALRANLSLAEGLEHVGQEPQTGQQLGEPFTHHTTGYTFAGVTIQAAFTPHAEAGERPSQHPVWLMDRAAGVATSCADLHPVAQELAARTYQAAKEAVDLAQKIVLDDIGLNEIVSRPARQRVHITKIDSEAAGSIEF
jgi:hypothetical protein